jgi:hypothetical protein
MVIRSMRDIRVIRVERELLWLTLTVSMGTLTVSIGTLTVSMEP